MPVTEGQGQGLPQAQAQGGLKGKVEWDRKGLD